MEAVKAFLKDLIEESKSPSNVFKRNILKEYLQVFVLDFIYSHPKYSELLFYGGSCLRVCFGLPRLSEDLDFVDLKDNIEITELAKDLENYFKKETDLNVIVLIQKFRIYLKFPILWELGLSSKNDSDLLFLKVEVFKDTNFCENYTIETIPVFKFNKSILIKTFDLATLMSTKIRAVLFRKWEKTNKEGKILASVKGRDYFDLMWYLEKGIKPNINCLSGAGVKNMEELKEKLLKIIEIIDEGSIKFDLEALIDDNNFVLNLSKNIKNILKRGVNSI